MLISKRMTRMAGLATALAIATTVAMTGCSATPGNASKTLTYWSMWKQGEPQQVVLAKAISKFEKETGIDVKVQWAGRNVIQQVTPRQVAGNPPDLFDQAGSAISGAFAKNNGVLGLSDVYDSKPTGESKEIGEVVPKGLSSLYTNSKHEPILVPYEVTGTTLWYNGLKLPDLSVQTWSEFTSELDKLKAQGQTPIAVDGDQSYYEAYWFVLSALRHGGADVITDIATDKTGKAADNPAVLAAAKDLFPLIQGGYMPSDFSGTKWPAQQSAWADGSSKTSFLLMGSWAPSETGGALQKSGIDVASTIQYRSTPFPTVAGGKGNQTTWVDDFGFAIPSKAQHADAAKQFIRFFTAKDQMEGIASTAANLTPRADIAAPEGLADFADEYQKSADAGQLVVNPDGSSANSQWASQVLYPTVADLFNKKFESPTAFVAALKQRTVATLAAQG
ncbi:ABC transporter substrate-binding protein [Leifsonia sp. NPDC058230]|uniref:ABC transporter substrate-binding protein n=1 Tax=Leifsonia sp. NPDC058230 TaxID=3346391 RepID=UPI0036DE08D7